MPQSNLQLINKTVFRTLNEKRKNQTRNYRYTGVGKTGQRRRVLYTSMRCEDKERMAGKIGIQSKWVHRYPVNDEFQV